MPTRFGVRPLAFAIRITAVAAAVEDTFGRIVRHIAFVPFVVVLTFFRIQTVVFVIIELVTFDSAISTNFVPLTCVAFQHSHILTFALAVMTTPTRQSAVLARALAVIAILIIRARPLLQSAIVVVGLYHS
jgi:hypothetical protein